MLTLGSAVETVLKQKKTTLLIYAISISVL